MGKVAIQVNMDFIMEIFKIINDRVLVYINGLMETFMKVNGIWVEDVEMEDNILKQKASFMKDSLSMERKMVKDACLIRME